MLTNNAINTFPSNRNLVIGGDFSINPWQRGTSFTVNHFADSADMWSYGIQGLGGTGILAISKDADSPTVDECGIFTTHSMLATVTTADPAMGINDQYVIVYGMEGYDWAQLAQKTITASFWVKSSLIGIYCISLINQGQDRSFVQEYTINAANTWEKKIITIPPSPSAGTWNYTNDLGIYFRWSLGGGLNSQITPGSWQAADASHSSNQVNFMATLTNTFRLNLFQLEPGETATPFEEKTFVETLANCQRYFYKSYDIGTNIGAITSVGPMGGFTSTSSPLITSLSARTKFNTRSTPTVTWYSPISGASGNIRNLTAGADAAVNNTATASNSSGGYPQMGSPVAANQRVAAHFVLDNSL